MYRGILDNLIAKNENIHPIEIEASCVLLKISGKALDKDQNNNNKNIKKIY